MQSLAELFRERGHRPALIDLRHGWSATYAELADLVGRVGALLLAQGLKPGDAVVQRLPNCPEALIVLLACLDRGLDCAPLSPRASAEEAADWVGLTGARLSVISALQADAAADTLTAMTPALRLNTTEPFQALPRLSDAASATAPGRLLIRTSGSTGAPKIVVQTAAALRRCARAFGARIAELDGEARVFATAPMFTLGGLFNVGLLPLELGCAVVLAEEAASVGAAKFWHDVARSQADVVWLAPSALRLVARARPVHPIRCAIVGMAPCTSQEKAAFSILTGAPVYENYGLSETLFIAASGDPGAGVGLPLDGVEVALRTPSAPSVTQAAPEEPRELCVRSPFLFAGYRQPDGSTQPPQLDADGFFHTNDLGRLEPDGALVLGGRLRAMIKRAGQPVFLPEIEAVARTLPGVADAAAVPTAGDDMVERYVLVVKPAPGVDAGRLAQQVRLDLAGRTARETWPDEICVTDRDFPLLAGGKLDYQTLKAALRAPPERPV